MKYWIWLTQLPFIGSKSANRLLEIFDDPKSIYTADREAFYGINGISRKQIYSILENKQMDRVNDILNRCNSNGISILTKQDKFYPNKAKMYGDAPPILYYKGNLRVIEHTVGIVGARRCSQETKQQVADITRKFISNNYTIISGMAKGVDSYAHTACINSNGYTIAILGNGLDICYPSEHIKLMESIEKNGLLISEYPPATPPAKYTFPQRNRLISAWSDELVIAEAGKGSGALITAEYARKYNKKVYFIPNK